jgi:hypothetical protein
MQTHATTRRAEAYEGSFPELGPPVVESDGVAHKFTKAYEAAKNIMAGGMGVGTWACIAHGCVVAPAPWHSCLMQCK